MAKSRMTVGRRAEKRNGHDERPYHHGNLREALVRCASDLLAERGISALSLREVARRIGVSQAAPYRHFPDKVSLLAAVAAEGFRGLSGSMTREADKASTTVERFEALGRGYIRFALDNAAMLRLMFGPEIECKADYPELRDAAGAAFATLAGTTAALADGADGQPGRTAALAAWSMVHGLSNLLIDGQIAVDETDDREAFISSVMSHLRV